MPSESARTSPPIGALGLVPDPSPRGIQHAKRCSGSCPPLTSNSSHADHHSPGTSPSRNARPRDLRETWALRPVCERRNLQQHAGVGWLRRLRCLWNDHSRSVVNSKTGDSLAARGAAQPILQPARIPPEFFIPTVPLAPAARRVWRGLGRRLSLGELRLSQQSLSLMHQHLNGNRLGCFAAMLPDRPRTQER